MRCTLLALLTCASIKGTWAWGNLGHETVAFIASNLVKANTKAWAQDVLDDTSSAYLANVATWADTYRTTAAGKFSAPYHFIDAEDNPPSSCSVDYNRDCGKTGCVVSAITNYTQRVQQTSTLPALQVNYALRWLVSTYSAHSCEDIMQ
jgi:hypothetical protein